MPPVLSRCLPAEPVPGGELREDPREEKPPPQSRGPRSTWALSPPGTQGCSRRIGGGPIKREKKVNSTVPQVLSELLMSKSAERFLLKTPKSFFFKSLARNNSHFDLDGVQMKSANSSRRHEELVPVCLLPGGRDGSSRLECSRACTPLCRGPRVAHCLQEPQFLYL